MTATSSGTLSTFQPPPPSPEALNTPRPSDTPGPLKEVCGSTGSYIILAILTDVTSPDTNADGAIGFRIVQVNFSGERIMVYGLPPELILSAANLQAYGLTDSTLSNAYNTVYNVERSNADAVSLAANADARMINENLGILASHYMVIDLAAIEKYVNKMGSLDVKLGGTFLSDEFDMQRGWQKLDGSLVRKYMTTKSKDGLGEWDRILRQNDIVNSFRTLAINQDPAIFISGFISLAEDGFASDLKTDQLSQLMCLTNSIEPVRFRFYSMPQSRVAAKEDGTLTVTDMASLRANIANTLGGTGE
ncbi:MAG TPA: LCP family protein [Leptolinea sp.]